MMIQQILPPITKIDSISGVGQVYMHCNRMIIVCRLPDADRQPYILTNLSR